MGKDIAISQELQNYMLGAIPPEPEVLQKLAKETLELGSASAMQISWLQACFMQNIIRMCGAKKTIEIGVFTGYSTLATALALPDGGTITALDVDKSWTDVGKKYWHKAGVGDKINLVIAPAIESLDGLINDGLSGSYDMVFIDADKPSMSKYLDRAY
ncbi:MAG: class I SAM-dependent methyltransferase, partial [Sphingomonadales bacterium]|nr:class I SAM-dependent methyltransferase [Sphingomonadales bacterium]